jgi:biotin carboxyl carrier protein
MAIKEKRKNTDIQHDISFSEFKFLNVMGDIYKTRLTKKYENRKKWKKPDNKKLFSYIPGTVCKVFIHPGDKVDTSSKLLLLEAMKMQNIIYSPVSGVVKSVLVKEGEKIGKGVLMVEFK